MRNWIRRRRKWSFVIRINNYSNGLCEKYLGSLSNTRSARGTPLPKLRNNTPAYNELIETRWTYFRDLKGVHDALEEMRVNGVEPDGRTKKLVEKLRREVGART